MQQLIGQLTEQYCISEQQVTGIICAVVNYAEEKAPSLGNSLSNMFVYDMEEDAGN